MNAMRSERNPGYCGIAQSQASSRPTIVLIPCNSIYELRLLRAAAEVSKAQCEEEEEEVTWYDSSHEVEPCRMPRRETCTRFGDTGVAVPGAK